MRKKPQCVCCETLKKHRLNILIAVIAFVSGFLFRLWTASPATLCNAAVVDVQQLINNSAAVRQLQTEMTAKQQELQKWVQDAQAEITKQTSQKQKEELTKKYEDELMQKQQALQQEYTQKLNTIDHDVTKLLNKEAKAEGYAIVLAKSSVLSGGTDITKDIVELIK